MNDPDPLIVERRSRTKDRWTAWKSVDGDRLLADCLRVFLDPDGGGMIEVREVGENPIQYRFRKSEEYR